MLDIEANRRSVKYSPREFMQRAAWSLGKHIFRLTPRPLFGVRRLILRLFGARIGRHVHIYASADIYFPWNLVVGDWSAIGEQAYIYNLGRISIGRRTTISQRAHLCAGTHDYTASSLPLRRPPISIGDEVWIAADAFVGPGVVVGNGAVVGARAVAVKDVQEWTVVAGNPARVVKRRIVSQDAAPPNQ